MKFSLILSLLFLSTHAFAATCTQVESFQNPVPVENGIVIVVPGALSQFVDHLLHFSVRIKEYSGTWRTKRVYPVQAVPYGNQQCQGSDIILTGTNSSRGLQIHQDWSGEQTMVSWVKYITKPTTICGDETAEVDEDFNVPMTCKGDLY